MVLKWTVRVMIVMAIFYGVWYSYEFINPWLGIIAGILIAAFIIDKLIKNKTKNRSKL